MAVMKYSQNLLDYFHHRDHAGEMDCIDPEVRLIEVGQAQNGEVLHLYVRCQHHLIVAASFKAAGSVALLAAAEFLCGWLEGKTYSDLDALTHQVILHALGLTDLSMHIAHLLMMAVNQLTLVSFG